MPASQIHAPPARRFRRRGFLMRVGLAVTTLLLAAWGGMQAWQRWGIPEDAPVIGVSYDTAWHAAAGVSVKNYEICLTRAGARIDELDCESDDPDEVLDRIDALLLTGGGDVAADLSGLSEDDVQAVDRRRDDFEIALIRGALERDMPVLGICRGIQILNVAGGGTLRNLRGDEELARRHGIGLSSFEAHRVHVTPQTRLATIVGPGDLDVNSFHGQAVGEIGEGLIVSAICEDGVVEALECPDQTFVLTTQWHPEVPPANMAFFERLIDEARRYRDRRPD